jgi:hypothetical protein
MFGVDVYMLTQYGWMFIQILMYGVCELFREWFE